MKKWEHTEISIHNTLRMVDRINNMSKYLEELSEQVLKPAPKRGRPKKTETEAKEE